MLPSEDFQGRHPSGRASPSPSVSPTPAIGACPELSRCVSTASSISNFSERSSSMTRVSLGSATSRQSSASYTSRQSPGASERPKRRGYVRPQGTNFAASAQSRESVMNLGSIAHLQYYFARTGLLEGRGGRLAKKKEILGEVELASLDNSLLSPIIPDRNLSYASSRSSPEVAATGGVIVESPIAEDRYDDFYSSDEEHPEMLPPTVSTYNHRPKYIPPPPTLAELKSDLQSALAEASKALFEASADQQTGTGSSTRKSEANLEPGTPVSPSPSQNQGWYEVQGMHILDILTLAIRAAKMYYTAHDHPTRLSTIKSERKIRAELLNVMEVLKRMATRNFVHGLKTEERETMEGWVEGVWDMLRQEEAMERVEREERLGWTWLDESRWTDAPSPIAREEAFLHSMNPDPTPIPPYTPTDLTGDGPLAVSPFLLDLRNGLRLVRLHNAAVTRSKRPFGAIATFHTDTRKPYRSAENLRYWIKAAELRWEVVLKVDVMGVVTGEDAQAWKAFEEAVWKWCKTVREEISAELR
ncbi:MAG: hypothetical protein M1818_003410 [Claussenomyces sp. TS43310]|nr:MAG: hypothetical protein M1818_003410 [Claussenomyces sp. TS43310]